MAMRYFNHPLHIFRAVHNNGETFLLQKEIAIANICFKANALIPLAFILYEFKI
jgi:hypothetical protein